MIYAYKTQDIASCKTLEWFIVVKFAYAKSTYLIV